MFPFLDRMEAGRVLGTTLREYVNRADVVVLALPRGGVPVGFEVAKALNAPVDIFVVRKLGSPGQEELAMGAIGSGRRASAKQGFDSSLHSSGWNGRIGVIYLPESEGVSHYFSGPLADQFDAVIHMDQTRAVEPLERMSQWEAGELPETYTFAV
jgi:hypothetical protein